MRRLHLLVSAGPDAGPSPRFPTPDEPLPAGAAAGWADLPDRWPRVDRAVTGPETRAVQTAVGVGLDATPTAALADLDLGSWVGRQLADVHAADPDGVHAWRTDPAAAPHGGEPVVDLVTRVGGWLAAAAAESEPRWVAVTHPAVVRAAVLVVLDAPTGAFWSIDAVPLEVTTLTHDGRRWALRSHGVAGGGG